MVFVFVFCFVVSAMRGVRAEAGHSARYRRLRAGLCNNIDNNNSNNNSNSSTDDGQFSAISDGNSNSAGSAGRADSHGGLQLRCVALGRETGPRNEEGAQTAAVAAAQGAKEGKESRKACRTG